MIKNIIKEIKWTWHEAWDGFSFKKFIIKKWYLILASIIFFAMAIYFTFLNDIHLQFITMIACVAVILFAILDYDEKENSGENKN